MSDKKWVKINEGMDIAFSLPCRGCYRYERVLGLNIGCHKPDELHGHIELCDEEGMYAFVIFPCHSQEGVKLALELIKDHTLSDEDCNVILNMEEIKNLPLALTDEEKLFLWFLYKNENPKKFVFWGWWGW